MEDKRVADYFVVAGLPIEGAPDGDGLIKLDEYSNEAVLKTSHNQDPIVDICVIIRSVAELCPPGYSCIDTTPNGHVADLNHGSIRAPEVYLCYRRGRDKPPITDIGVLYEGKEKVMPGCDVVKTTIGNRTANVNNNNNKTFINYRRADKNAASDMLAVTDICVIITSKGEVPPHAFCQIPKNLNRAMVGSDVYLCYKKSVAKTNTISFKPALLSRYPEEDHENLELPQSVPMFCLPLGVSVEAWGDSVHHPTPIYSTFVLTGAMGEKMYGAAVMFYEKLSRETLTLEDQQTLGVIKECVTSNNSDVTANNKTALVHNAVNDTKCNHNSTTPNSSTNDSSTNDESNCECVVDNIEDDSNVLDKDLETNVDNSKGGEVILTGKQMYQNKCICLLGRWPFFDTFRKYLSFLYRTSLAGPQPVPIERYISHFINEIPFPSPQRPNILIQLKDESISLSQLEETPLTQSGASFITLLKNMGPDNCLLLLLLILLESKILVHSLRPAVLTSVAEALANIIFPFHWQCPYIPLCPLGLSDVLNAPCPFIVGIDSRYFDLYDPPAEVTCVDIDTNNITMSDEKRSLTWKLLPKRPVKVLKASLEKLFEQLTLDQSIGSSPNEVGIVVGPSEDHDFSKHKKQLAMELRIREAFLRFMASILKGYNNYLLPITQAPTPGTTDLRSLFDTQGFLKSRDKSYYKFFAFIMKTQEFSRFIEERSFVSDKDASLAFFDECTEKVEDYKDEPKLIEADDTSKSERTVFIPLPEPVGMTAEENFNYSSFPALKQSLFMPPTKPVMVTPMRLPRQCPSTPLTRRTKQEVKSAQKVAQKHQGTPMLWAKCLLSHCYSLWFIHLPSYVKTVHSKPKALRTAYNVLVRMQNAKLQPPDEVCYRVLLQLCGVYEQPVLAVRVLFEMKRSGIKPNAITYGFYNKAVLESKWPSSQSADQLWSKIRNLVMAVSQFRQALRVRHPSTNAYSTTSESDGDQISRTSVDSIEENGLLPEQRTQHQASAVHSMVNKATINHNTDLISIGSDSPNIEERVSTGGMSDRGYSSMTLEDSKRISQVISSEDSLDSLTATAHRRNLSDTIPIHSLPSNGNHNAGNQNAGAVATSTPVHTIVRANSKDIENRVSAISEDSCINSPTNTPQAVEHAVDCMDTPKTPHPSHSSAGGAQRVLFPESSSDKPPELSPVEPHEQDTDLNPLECQQQDSNLNTVDGHNQSVPSIVKTPDVLEGIKQMDVTQDSVFEHDTEEPLQGNMSKSNSPIHSVRTPVTDNDPLGLFLAPTDVKPTVSGSVDLLLSVSDAQGQKELDGNGKMKLQKAVSFDSSDPQDPKSFQHIGQEQQSTDTTNATSASQDELGAEPGPGDRSWTKRGRNLIRGESINKAWKFTTNMWNTKYNELKQNMTPIKGVLSASNTSLPTDGNEPDGTTKQPAAQKIRHTGSLDDLDEMDAPDGPDGGVSAGSTSRLNKYGGYMSGLFEKSLQVIPALPSLAYVSVDAFRSVEKGARADSQASLDQAVPAPSTSSQGDSESISSDRKPDTESISSDRRRLTGSVNSLLSTTAAGQSTAGTLFSVACQVDMCTVSRCTSCAAFLYDEEIMAGWSADDSNLNTTCQFCNHNTVPMLNIYIKDMRHCTMPVGLGCGQSIDSMQMNYKPAKEAKEANTVSSDKQDGTSVSNLIDISEEKPTGDKAITESLDDYQPVNSTDGESVPEITLESSVDGDGAQLLVDLGHDGSAESSSDPVVGAVEHSSDSDSVIQDTPTAIPPCDPLGVETELIALDDPLASQTVTPTPDTAQPTDQLDPLVTESEPSISEVPHAETPTPEQLEALTESGTLINVTPADTSSIVDDTEMPPTTKDMSFTESQSDSCSVNNGIDLDPISVPYLSPLVLRKEMESLLDQDGELCMSKESFLDEHPIIYWNLVWYFKRLDTTSHLAGLVLTAPTVNKHATMSKHWVGADSRHVLIQTMWDNVHMHTPDLGVPMYKLWNNLASSQDITYDPSLSDSLNLSRGVMQQIVSNIMKNDVVEPIKMILNERRKHRSSTNSPPNKTTYRSIYRDILFLAFVALDRENIDHDAFDREFTLSCGQLGHREKNRMRVYDRNPNMRTIWARKLFSELLLE